MEAGKVIGGRQWVRVFGPNLQPGHAERGLKNKSTVSNQVFISACEAVGIQPSRRQASKWNNKKGKAYGGR